MSKPAIWLPPSHAIHNKKPIFLCNLCEAVWFEEEDRHEFERHCLRAHSHEEIREHSLAVQAPGLFDRKWDGADREWDDWIEKNEAAGKDPMRYMRTDEGKT